MLNKEDVIKLDCRIDVLKYLKKKLDNITVEDFYSAEEYEIIRKEYMEIAELIRDKDLLMELKEKRGQGRNKNISKFFKMER